VQSLSGLEPVIFPEPFGTLEAFHTSGGISMMVDDGTGKVETMYYKTLRYPGHCSIFKALQEMGMMDHGPVKVEGRDISPRRVLEASLARTLPKDGPDATLMRIEATGTGTGAGKERTRVIQMVDRPDKATGLSSMMRTTTFPTSIMAQMVHDGILKVKGVFTPERVVDGEALISALREKGRNVLLENVRE
jgi:lysine 6-dehydrogenase